MLLVENSSATLAFMVFVCGALTASFHLRRERPQCLDGLPAMCGHRLTVNDNLLIAVST